MSTIPAPLVATCHCKAFRLSFSAPIENVTRCTCTFCSKHGILWAYGKPADLKIEQAGDDVVYPGGDSPNRHHHCGRCGCSLYSETPDWSTGQADMSKPKIGVNAALFDNVVGYDLPTIVIDGKNLW